MSAAVASATTVEPTATAAVKPASTTSVEPACGTASETTARESATMIEASASGKSTAPAIKAPATEPTVKATAAKTPTAKTVAVKPPSIETTSAIKAVEPGTGADKDPAVEPIRAVVAVRRAIIRVVSVVAVSARRARTDVNRAHANHNLRLRRNRRWEHANCQ